MFLYIEKTCLFIDIFVLFIDRSSVGYREIKDEGPYENPEVQWTMANVNSVTGSRFLDI